MRNIVHAVRLLNTHLTHKVQLRIVGHYSPEHEGLDLEQLAAGTDDFLEFCPVSADRAGCSLILRRLPQLFHHILKGFLFRWLKPPFAVVQLFPQLRRSLGSLSIRKRRCLRHDSVEQLTERLSRIIADESFRERLVSAQAPLPQKYHEEAVGDRFWNFIMERFQRWFLIKAPAIQKRIKPKVAVLSPFPPDQSGVARFTELTLQAASKWFDIDLFQMRRVRSNCRTVCAIWAISSIHAMLKTRYDSILSVIGNSHFHTPIFEMFERYGGPCIMHDSRLTQIYFHRLGEQEFLKFACNRLGRPVTMDEVRVWLQDQQLPSSLHRTDCGAR